MVVFAAEAAVEAEYLFVVAVKAEDSICTKFISI
jgi:hypothetical protein